MELSFEEAFESLSALSLNSPVAAFKSVTVEHGMILQIAPNEVVFAEHKDFLAAPKLFPFQYQVIRDFFELLCPDCNDLKKIALTDEEVLTSDKFKGEDVALYDEIRKEEILFEYDYCPSCGKYKYDFPPEQWVFPNELVALLGRRSGKTALSGMISLTKLYEFILIPDLQEKLGIVKNKQLAGLFAATTKEQTESTIFGDVVNFFENSPWYQNLKTNLIALEKKHGKKKGTYYSDDSKGIYLGYKNINLKALHSNSASIAGDTAIICALDELAKFDSTESKRSATEMYASIKYSLQTVISSALRKREKGDYSIPDALMINSSTPMFGEDKMMNLYNESLTNKRMFGIRRATWEANPTIKLEDLEEDYRKDPIVAERDFGANPPAACSPFIKNASLVDLCIGDYNSNVLVKDKFFSINGINYISLDIVNVRFSNVIDYVIHCDCGRNHDSFGMAIGHLEHELVVIDGAIEGKPVTKVNKYKLPPHAINFDAMINFVLLVAKKLNAKIITFDQWNSAGYVDKLISNGFCSIAKNLDREDHCRFRESIESGLVTIPQRESEILDPRVERNMPCAKAIIEIKQLEDDGKKIDHPRTGTNDIVQCYVGVHRILKTPDKLGDINKIKSYVPFRGSSKKCNGKVVRLKRFI